MNVAKLLDDPDASRDYLSKIMATFADWIERTAQRG